MSGLDEQLFAEVNERLRKDKYSGLLRGLPRSLKPKAEETFVSDDHLFAIQKQIIEQLADTESCVIVGKCADWVLKDRDHVISVYIEAPRSFCLPRIMKKMQVSSDIANLSITKTDQYRAAYYEYYTCSNYWTNPINYDLTLNSALVGLDNCVTVIKQYLKLKFPEFFNS